MQQNPYLITLSASTNGEAATRRVGGEGVAERDLWSTYEQSANQL